MTTDRVAEHTWGPLDTEIHDGDHPPGSPPWKDNVFIAFWDDARNVYACLHLSTSPNADGRRARFSFQAEERSFEVIEPLERGTFDSYSIRFDLSGTLVVAHPRLNAEFRFRPTTAYADLSGNALPTLNHEPLRHYQVTVQASGEAVFDGRRVRVDGTGIRDRTWGYREMSLNMPEYVWFFAAYPNYSVTAFRFIDITGEDRSDGYILGDEARRIVTGVAVTRDPSGLCSFGELTLQDGSTMTVRSRGRRAGFWLPMEWERRGPMMSAYDEFCGITDDLGAEGFGVIEHGQIRNLF